MKAFLFRHQHGGVDASRVFLKPPTDEQMSAMNTCADAVYGDGWGMVVETELVEGDAVPEFNTSDSEGSGEPGEAATRLELMTFGAIGHVEELA